MGPKASGWRQSWKNSWGLWAKFVLRMGFFKGSFKVSNAAVADFYVCAEIKRTTGRPLESSHGAIGNGLWTAQS